MQQLVLVRWWCRPLPGKATGAADTPGGTWHWLNPLPQGPTTEGLARAGDSVCYAEGNHGTILVTHNDGASWTSSGHRHSTIPRRAPWPPRSVGRAHSSAHNQADCRT